MKRAVPRPAMRGGWKSVRPGVRLKNRTVRAGRSPKNTSACAVFTEQGSSQMTAAKIMDIISRLPDCDGQAADAVSAYTQVKMEDAHKLLKIPKSDCPDI